jgi:hypothetical protein
MFDVASAKKAGYTDQEIQQYLASKSSSGQSQPTQPSSDLISTIGNGAINLGKSLVDPFIRTGKNVGGATFELGRAGATAVSPLFGVSEKDRYNLYYNKDTQEAVQNPFLNDEEIAKASQPLSLDKGSTMRQQVADSASIGSWAVPFGKGANVLTKATLPGATVGVMQKVGESGNRDLSAGEVAGSAIVGGAIPTALYGIGKAKGVITKAGDKTTKVGTDVTHSVRQIRMKPSVGGAQDEKAINQVLDSLIDPTTGKKYFTGSPQQQYEKLQPAMTDLEGIIRSRLNSSTQTFSKQSVRDEIIQELNTQGLLIGDKAKKLAEQAVDDVLDDVIAKDGSKKLTSIALFEAKQKLNAIAQKISEKMDKGGNVTPREEVLSASRDALDKVIANNHPDVKNLTMAQSRLFDSARSLSSARSNPPVLRAMGTSIPAVVTTGGKVASGKIVENTGKLMSKAGKMIPDVPMNYPVGQASARIIPAIDNLNNDPQNSQQNVNDNSTNGQANGQLNGGEYDSQVDSPNTILAPKVLNPYGASIDELGQLLTMALASGDKTASEQLTAMYKLELDNATRQEKANSPVKRTEAQQASFDAQELAKLAISQLDEGGIKTGPIDPRIEQFKAIGNMGDQKTLDFNNSISQIKATIAKARAGTSFTPNEEKLLNQYTPQVGDSDQQLRTKLNGLVSFFARRNNSNVISDQEASMGSLISAFGQ